MKVLSRILILATVLVSLLISEIPYEFTEIAHYDPDDLLLQGKAFDVVVDGVDSLVYSAWGTLGLYVHKIIDNNLVFQSHFKDDNNHWNLLICQDGLILSADYYRDVHVFRYEGGSLHEVSFLDRKARTMEMVQGPDSTIFMASNQKGLYAYKFESTSLILSDSIKSASDGIAHSLAVNSLGKIFLANGCDGIRVYTYNDNTFRPEAHLGREDDFMESRHIELINDSTFIAANYGYEHDRLQVYHYTDSIISLVTEFEFDDMSFTIPSSTDLKVDSHQTIFYSRGSTGLYVFRYVDSELVPVCSRNIFNRNMRLSLLGNKLFQAMGDFGLYYYGFKGNRISYLDDFCLGNVAKRLEKISNDRFVVSMGPGGLQQFQYSDGEFNLISKNDLESNVIDVSASVEGAYIATASENKGFTLYRNYFDHLLKIFNVMWEDQYWNFYNYSARKYYSVEITNTRHLYCAYRDYGEQVAKKFTKPSYTWNETYLHGYYHIENEDIYQFLTWQYEGMPKDIESDNTGKLFLAGGSGLFEKKYNSFIDLSAEVQKINVSDNNILFIACGEDGLYSIKHIAPIKVESHIDDGGFACGVTSVGCNLVFLANSDDGLRAYSYQDTGFTCIAHINTPGSCNDVMILSDSTIIVADGYGGLSAYEFNGWIQSQLAPYPTEFGIYQNYPNPFNPITTISYKLPMVSDVELAIYDLSGRKIRQWSYQNQIAGPYEISWNGQDQSGNPAPSGVYIYRMVAGEYVGSKKMVLLK